MGTSPASPPPSRSLVVPVLWIAAAFLAVVPWLHPNNTCHDWLMKWGQLVADPMWRPIHQAGMAGFALASSAGILLALSGPRSWMATLGGAAFSAGYAIQAMLVMIHASAVATIGRAHNAAAGDAARQQLLRTMAEAFVNYDVACSGVAAVFISGGAILLTLALARARVFSPLVGLVMAGVASLWVLAYVGYTYGEWLPYTSLATWLGAMGALILVDGSRQASRQGAGHEHEPETSAPQQADQAAAGRLA